MYRHNYGEKLHDPNDLNNVMFCEEDKFVINGNVNRHNLRYGPRNNPNLMRETHTQFPETLNVCAGIICDKIIASLFIEGNLNRPEFNGKQCYTWVGLVISKSK